MIQDFLIKLLIALLTKLVGGAVTEVKRREAEVKRDQERGVTNAKNVEKYQAASTRADRIRAALDLLNRTPSGVSGSAEVPDKPSVGS